MNINAPLASQSLAAGTLASALSGAVLAWRGRGDAGSAAAALNAPSHWLWGRDALQRNEATVRHTAVGSGVHWASAMLWGTIYELVRSRRRRPTVTNAMTDAAAVTVVAAVVDLKLVPERLTPGFQHRLSRGSLLLVYASFAAGLAVVGLRNLSR